MAQENIRDDTTSGEPKTVLSEPSPVDALTSQDLSYHHAPEKETESAVLDRENQETKNNEEIQETKKDDERDQLNGWLGVLKQSYQHCRDAGIPIRYAQVLRNGEVHTVIDLRGVTECPNCGHWFMEELGHKCPKKPENGDLT